MRCLQKLSFYCLYKYNCSRKYFYFFFLPEIIHIICQTQIFFKGPTCQFRHVEAAKTCKIVCQHWQMRNCFRPMCKFRHSTFPVSWLAMWMFSCLDISSPKIGFFIFFFFFCLPFYYSWCSFEIGQLVGNNNLLCTLRVV